MFDIVKRALCAFTVLTAVLFFTGCVERFVGEDTDYSTGDVLTPEMIESIFEAISTPVTEKYPTETLEDGSVLLYWLEGGSVWHTSLLCGSISKATPDNLHSGNIEEALSAGKKRGCKICAENAQYETDAYIGSAAPAESTDEVTQHRYSKDYDENGDLIVYWVKNGTVWHISKECSSLSKSSDADIFSGTEFDAQAIGKERACKICSENN